MVNLSTEGRLWPPPWATQLIARDRHLNDGSSKPRRHSTEPTQRPSIVHVWSLCVIVTIQEPICTFFFLLTRRSFKIITVPIRSTHAILKDPSEEFISWPVMRVSKYPVNRRKRLLVIGSLEILSSPFSLFFRLFLFYLFLPPTLSSTASVYISPFPFCTPFIFPQSLFLLLNLTFLLLLLFLLSPSAMSSSSYTNLLLLFILLSSFYVFLSFIS